MKTDPMRAGGGFLRWAATRRAMLLRTTQAVVAGGVAGLTALSTPRANAQAAWKEKTVPGSRFTDNGDTITDHQTGLMWEKKQDAEAVSWREAPHSVNAVCTWAEANGEWIDTINGSAFAGFSDWRVPSAHELVTIIEYGRPRPPAIDPIFGPVAAAFYWSSTPLSFRPGLAWDVFFLDGVVFVDDQGNGNRVRAVWTVA